MIRLTAFTALCLAASMAVALPDRAPLASPATAVSSHAPYESGDCNLCHAEGDRDHPGPVLSKGAEGCLGCHEEFGDVFKRKHVHKPLKEGCIACHNPHNATARKLLVANAGALCLDCHTETAKLLASAKVPHKALTTGAQCLSCHEPHSSTIDGLLLQESFDLCLKCHDTDTMVSTNGRKLQNIKAWLDTNKVWHGPVETKDCSDCHDPHGADHFRLLTDDYPQEFYAPYDASAYALCFACHREKAFSTARTTTLTKFRNGEVNLHYLHLQQGGRGRTCRACHEVHASKQPHHLREGVPYGSSGWVLKLNYVKTPDGGSCAKTCHAEKGYVNGAAARK